MRLGFEGIGKVHNLIWLLAALLAILVSLFFKEKFSYFVAFANERGESSDRVRANQLHSVDHANSGTNERKVDSARQDVTFTERVFLAQATLAPSDSVAIAYASPLNDIQCLFSADDLKSLPPSASSRVKLAARRMQVSQSATCSNSDRQSTYLNLQKKSLNGDLVARALWLTHFANDEQLRALSLNDVQSMVVGLIESGNPMLVEIAVGVVSRRGGLEPPGEGDTGASERRIALTNAFNIAICEVYDRCAAVDYRLAMECAQSGICDTRNPVDRLNGAWVSDRYALLAQYRSVSFTESLREGQFDQIICIFGDPNRCWK
jgi:hypothetical protein